MDRQTDRPHRQHCLHGLCVPSSPIGSVTHSRLLPTELPPAVTDLQFGAGVLVPEAVLAVCPHCSQGGVGRVEGNVIHL